MPQSSARGAARLGSMPKRIVPSHFNKDGKPKRGYVKEEVARAEAARFGKTYYRCDFCNRFHLASR
jgi:hypothetical protein